MLFALTQGLLRLMLLGDVSDHQEGLIRGTPAESGLVVMHLSFVVKLVCQSLRPASR